MQHPIDLNDYAQEIHDNSLAHGWWPPGKEPDFGTVLCLIHSEVSEALEAYRTHGIAAWHGGFDDDKPEGVPSELADVIIRVLDCCAAYGIDIQYEVTQKMRYNESRTIRHGGKAF